jgi:hypothetical protein
MGDKTKVIAFLKNKPMAEELRKALIEETQKGCERCADRNHA